VLENLLKVENLTKTFGKRAVLSDVTFDIHEAEVLGLIGPNGAGKTTLFECVAGLIPTAVGSVTFRKRQLDQSERKQALFYFPDGITPWSEQRVSWVLKFFKNLYSRSTQRLESLSDKLRLSELMNSRLATLSKGERKRVMLALGLLTPQPLLLLDEPFDGLDLRQTRDVMSLLREERVAGKTLMLSIHQLVDAGRVCDRVVLLNNGRAVAEGDFAKLRAQANLSEGGLEEIFLALT
jgi:ABC-type multidrug transport system ATPase subunit